MALEWKSMRLMFFIILLLPTVTAFSIFMENDTFEAGSFDVQIRLKISPTPQDVRKFTWHHCSSPGAWAAFYEIDTLENRIQRTGELGERTSHLADGNGQEYSITLVITDLKDTDQGEYCCVVQIADEVLLQGNMRLTKLEALREISATNVTVGVGISVMSLVIRMFPSNVTLYWVKCFHSLMPESSAHFYTYDITLNKVIAAGDLGTRTSHRFDRLENNRLFSLVIQRLGPGDAGPYCCQIDAVGLLEPRLVVMWMELVATSSYTVIEIGTATNINTTSKLGEVTQESFILRGVVVSLAVLLLITTGLSIYFYWKRRIRQKTQEKRQQLLQNSDSRGKIIVL